MFDQMKQLYEMRKLAKEMEKRLEAMSVEHTSLGGRVKVVLNGKSEVQSLTIDESLVAPGQKFNLERALSECFTKASAAAQKESAAKNMDLMKGLKIPGMG
jgi:DNA-binding protein YbaB